MSSPDPLPTPAGLSLLTSQGRSGLSNSLVQCDEAAIWQYYISQHVMPAIHHSPVHNPPHCVIGLPSSPLTCSTNHAIDHPRCLATWRNWPKGIQGAPSTRAIIALSLVQSSRVNLAERNWPTTGALRSTTDHAPFRGLNESKGMGHIVLA